MDISESQTEGRMQEGSAPETPANPQLHDLVPFVIANRIFAVLAEHVEGTAEARSYAALPRAPAAILGVVCARGRMLTVLDPFALTGAEVYDWPKRLPCVIALRGDEQLALAAEKSLDALTIASSDIERDTESPEGEVASAIMGIARYGGQEITVLDADQLFAAAVRRKERRRRRF